VHAEIRHRLEVGAGWSAGRQILRKLIDGRLTMTAKVINGGRFYEITWRATYGRLFEGVLVNVVAPG
jgi:hypothetical protein